MKIQRARAGGDRRALTVVIPCYNYGRYLTALVERVLSEPDVDIRVIIIDDASTDDSLDIGRSLEAADARVSVVAHPVNKGHIATYNEGLALVDTEFATLVSADDLVARGALARAVGLMVHNPSVGMVYGFSRSFQDDDLPAEGPAVRATWTVWSGTAWLRLATWRGRNFVSTPEVVMRTEAVRDVGTYNPGLPHAGDLEYWLRTAARWDVGRVNGPVQAYYRVHGQNMHLTRFQGSMVTDLRERRAAFESGLAGAGAMTEADLARARRALAREAVNLAVRILDQGRPAEEALALEAFAIETDAVAVAGSRGRRLRSRIARASNGRPPAATHSAAEYARRAGDKVKWHIWANSGIS